MKSLMNKEQRRGLRALGWRWHKFYISKSVGKYEIDIEFCIGDCCLGIYENKWLVAPKKRCESFIEALAESILLEEEYKNL